MRVRGGIPARYRAATFAALLFLAACSGREADGPVIRFWQFWESGAIEPIVREFEAQNPGITVEVEQLTWKSGLEKIQAAIVSGTQPDLCELGSTWLPRFSYEGVLEDLTSLYHELEDSFLMWESAMWKDKVYGLPWVQGSRVLFYNRSLFKQAGLNPDEPPRTWQELLEAARRISALDNDVWGFGLNLGERYVLYKKFMALAWGNGGRILDESFAAALFDSREIVQTLEFYLELADYSLKEKQQVLDHFFKSGRLGLQISGAWNLKNYALEAPEIDYAVALVPKPADDEGYHSSFAGAEMLVVFKKSKKKAEAIKLARFLQDYPQAKKLSLEVGSVLPAAKKALHDSTFLNNDKLNVFIRQAFTSRTAPAHPGWLEMEDVINRAIEEVIYGRTAPEKAVAVANAKIQAVVEKFEKH